MAGWLDGWQSGWRMLNDWYAQPSKNEDDYNLRQFVGNLPFVGSWLKAGDSSRAMNDYLQNRGLDWSDIRYNRAPFSPTYGSAAASTTVGAMNLYRSAFRPRSAKKSKSLPRGKRQHALAATARTANGSRRVYQNRMFLRRSPWARGSGAPLPTAYL